MIAASDAGEDARSLSVKQLQTIRDVREFVGAARTAGRRIGFVPTMGALHEGHFSLIRTARSQSDTAVVSIFVNPTQFGPNEDYQRYPRPIDADLAGCEREGVGAVFCPSVQEMYPTRALTTVALPALTRTLCGPHRPGHFDGVATVVAKLFQIVQPDRAFFGQKDYQQSVIVRRMVADLNMPVEVVVCPTVREADGLAMSSRNAYLSAEDRRQALSLSQALFAARDQVAAGQRDALALVQQIRRHIQSAGPCRIDYAECVDAADLTPQSQITGPCAIAVAVRIGATRLIDNVLVG